MSDDQAQVEVTIPKCPGSPFTLNPGPGSPGVLQVCKDAQFRDTGPAVDYAIGVTRVDAPVPKLHVVFKSHHTAANTDDAFLVFPKVQLASSYRVMAYRGLVTCHARWLAVNPSTGPITLNYQNCDDTPALPQAVPSGNVFQQLCAPGTVLQDGTGSLVSSSGPDEKFALIAGSTCSRVPPLVLSADTLMEMMPPETWAGTEYLATEFPKALTPAPPGDLFRLMALEGGATSVTVAVVAGGSSAQDNTSGRQCNSNTAPTLSGPGDWCDLSIERGARITSNRRILVGHFAKGIGATGTGDPTFVLVTPSNRFRCSHRFFSFAGFDYDQNTKDGTYVNIVADQSIIDNVQLDTATLISGATCLDYTRFDYPPPSTQSWARCRLANPPVGGKEHIITTSSNLNLVAAYPHGMRLQGAYAYQAGVGF